MNSFGQRFRVTTWGESHGLGVGVVVDGCVPELELSVADIQGDLDRRRPNQSTLTTQRNEGDVVTIHSGVFEGKTLGTPIALSVRNVDARPEDYEQLVKAWRPSHGDYSYHAKYGIHDPRGGGRGSARETVGRVAAGAIAKKILSGLGVQFACYVERIGSVGLKESIADYMPDVAVIEASAVRCPDPDTAKAMIAAIEQARSEGDSLGGAIVCRITGAPRGLGEPVFDKLEADLAKAMLSIPAVKAFEIGSGFEGTYWTGSKHNDAWVEQAGMMRTRTNHSGGIQGGISNGEAIYFRVGFKPTATIARAQDTLTMKGEPTSIQIQGRHDPCVLPRAVPIVEAMAALVLVDHYLRQKIYE